MLHYRCFLILLETKRSYHAVISTNIKRLFLRETSFQRDDSKRVVGHVINLRSKTTAGAEGCHCTV